MIVHVREGGEGRGETITGTPEVDVRSIHTVMSDRINQYSIFYIKIIHCENQFDPKESTHRLVYTAPASSQEGKQYSLKLVLSSRVPLKFVAKPKLTFYFHFLLQFSIESFFPNAYHNTNGTDGLANMKPHSNHLVNLFASIQKIIVWTSLFLHTIHSSSSNQVLCSAEPRHFVLRSNYC